MPELAFKGEASPDRPAYAVCCDGVFLAYGDVDSNLVQVAYLRNLAAPTLELHTQLQCKPATAIFLAQGTIGTSDPVPRAAASRSAEASTQALLCVGSQDSVVIWQLAAAYAAAADGQPPPEPIQVMSRQGQVDALTISAPSSSSSHQQHLAICAGMDIHVFELRSLRNTYRLEGHHAPVLAACFCEPHYRHLLVTAGEDRSFKVWDLQQGAMVYQSAILTASPLTSVAVDPSYPRMAVGASDGTVRFYDLSSLPACRALQTVDVSKHLQKISDRAAEIVANAKLGSSDGPVVVSANRRGGGQQQQQETDADEEPSSIVAGSACVICMHYCPPPEGGLGRGSYSDEGDGALLGGSPKLLVGTNKALAVVDTHTYEVEEGHYLRGSSAIESLSMNLAAYVKQAGGSLPPNSERQLSQYHFVPECSIAGVYAFAPDPTSQQGEVTCCISAAFEPLVSVFSLNMAAGTEPAARRPSSSHALEPEHQERPSSGGQPPTVSVFMTQPLPASSVLRASSSLSESPSTSSLGTLQRSNSAGRGSSPTAAAGSSAKRGSSPGSGMSPSKGPGSVASSASGLTHTRSSGAGSTGAGTKKVANQPVTFSRNIKSSGYGFVQPQVRMGRAPPAPVKVTKGVATSSVGKHLAEQRQYPVDCGPLIERQARNALPGNAPAHGSAILRVSYSSDASRVLTASADRTARVMKLPMSKYQGEGTDLIAHNAAVLSATWSHDGTMVLTASADRTARMWNAGCAQPLLEFTHIEKQVSPLAPNGSLPPLSPAPAQKAPPDNNKPFTHEVRAAQFYYLDQFVLLASSNKLNLYRYKLNVNAGDDLERLRNTNKYKLVASYASGSQCINALSCYNSFLSPLALIAGSNKSVEVVDVPTMKCVATLEDTHARPPHALVQSVDSLFVSHAKEAHELFATASQDNTAKLWDARSSRCVRTFSGHKNSQIATNIAFSPCLRYLASGSEDKAAYIYDMRMGTVLHRIRGVHGDAVMDVAFNPLHPQLVAACLDGRLHFYSDTL